MDEFAKRFTALLELLEFRIGLPKPQCEHIRHYPNINPTLYPRPQDWWQVSFDWFIAVDLIPGREYGPFYILHDDWFWPQIGNPEIIDSERKCFFGLERPSDIKDAEDKYKQNELNLKKYLYEFKLKIDDCFACCIPLIFLGPVKGGTGFQMNPNRIACTAIKMAIIQKIKRYEVKDGITISDESEEYGP